MVKIPPQPVNGSALFKEAADALLTPMNLAEIADALDCSVPALRQARLEPSYPSFRNPPGGWEVTMRRLLEAKADHFAKLARRISPTG